MDWQLIALIAVFVVCCIGFYRIYTAPFYPEYDEREYEPEPLRPWEDV